MDPSTGTAALLSVLASVLGMVLRTVFSYLSAREAERGKAVRDAEAEQATRQNDLAAKLRDAESLARKKTDDEAIEYLRHSLGR